MKKALFHIALLLMFAAFLLPKSHAQVVGFYPEVDTIFVGGGCTPPYIICSLIPSPPAQDIIQVTPEWNTWMWYEDEFGSQQNIDYGYFLVDDSLNRFEYEIWYIPEGWPLTGPVAVPLDSAFLCEGYIARLQLKVLQNGVAIDSFSQPWVSVYGLPVEPVENARLLPRQLELLQNFPNPFNAATHVEFGLPESGDVRVEIFNSLGRRVYAEYARELSAGYHVFTWNGRNSIGQDVASGVYYYKISKGRETAVRKMILLR
jgi:hypothetical protein